MMSSRVKKMFEALRKQNMLSNDVQTMSIIEPKESVNVNYNSDDNIVSMIEMAEVVILNYTNEVATNDTQIDIMLDEAIVNENYSSIDLEVLDAVDQILEKNVTEDAAANKESNQTTEMDYVESTSNYVQSSDDEAKENANKIRKRSTKYKIDNKTWTVNRNRANREKGKSYRGKKKEDGVWRYDLLKEPRVMKEPCDCKISKNNNSKLQCARLTHDTRLQLFMQFWEYTWKEKKIYVRSHVSVNRVERKRGEQEVSRRTYSNKFYLGEERLRICKKMFLNTLGVKEWVIKKWAKTSWDVNPVLPEQILGSDDKTSMKLLHIFFDSLPKLESHYCRSSTSKLYLEPIWESKAHLHKVYSEFCNAQDEKVKPLSIATFHKEFDNKRLSLYKPKKDLCDTCVAFETGNLNEEQYNEHLQLKREAREEKSRDKNSQNEIFTMDLQSVLVCPKSNVSSLYYKTKLIVHNFTIYDLRRQQGHCYVWNV